MPSFSQNFPNNASDNSTAFAIAYQALLDLNWDILFASEKNIVAHTGKQLMAKGQSVSVEIDNNYHTVTSTMIAGELTDLFKVNKKNTNKFVKAFTAASATSTDILDAHKVNIEKLKAHTLKVIDEEEKEEAELAEVMNLGGGHLYGTYALVAVNIIVFILMVLNGAGILVPNGYVHIKWGSNFSPLTLSGDWWRLISSTFIHFGVIHLLMNMYCLFTIGNYMERMIGTGRFLVAYLCTGALAGILSLWWHTDVVNSAGASGAVFGMYGLFLAMLTTKLIPKKGRQEMLKNIAVFVAFNLIYGLKAGIDNAAHVGGLVSGFAIGYLYIYSLNKERHEDTKLRWIIPTVIACTLLVCGAYLSENKVEDSARQSVNKELYEATFADNERFNDKLVEFDKVHQEILTIHDSELNFENHNVNSIEQEALPKLAHAQQLIATTTSLHISPESHLKAKKIMHYISLRTEEMKLMQEMVKLKDTAGYRRVLISSAAANAAFNEAAK